MKFKNFCTNILLVLVSLLVSCCDDGREVKPETGGGDTPKPANKEKVYYVSANGSDDNTGIAPSFALKTVGKALSFVKPGDVIKIMPGTYRYSKRFIDMPVQYSGKEGKYITIEAQDPDDKPKVIVGGTGVWEAVDIVASYVILDGIEFEGFNQQLDSLEAYNNAVTYHDFHDQIDWNYTAQFNTNGVSVGDHDYTTTHVIIRNCVIHDFPGGGLGASDCDYITFENNVIYNNAWFNMYACSGISIISPVNTDSNTGHKLIVKGNTVYNNRCMIPWCTTADFRLSDGNGIIIDVNQHPADSGIHKNEGPYNGRTLVLNNVSFNNGGSGIHTFKADHVDVINNTSYWNGYKYPSKEYGEIYSNQSKDGNFINNIMYGRPGCYCNGKADATITYSHNIYFGGEAKTMGTGDKKADPKFVKLSRDGSVADFHITAGSAAIGAGIVTDITPKEDRDGNARGATMDCGAYQYSK